MLLNNFKQSVVLYICFVLLFACSSANDISETIVDEIEQDEEVVAPITSINFLALGDSYTIGQSVCEACKFPSQLKDSLLQQTSLEEVNLKVIARTGWTTTNLQEAILDENINADYHLVTLLIGVNNQYQNKAFSIYEKEFPELLNTAISKAKNDKSKVIVLSIPDYAFTPFGRGNTLISSEIDTYNAFAESYCATKEVTFVNITDITRLGLENPALVASDNLHPSELAYKKFVERLLPIAKEKLNLE